MTGINIFIPVTETISLPGSSVLLPVIPGKKWPVLFITKPTNMITKSTIIITVEAIINLPVEKTWQLWTTPENIMRWNNASDDWHTPKAESDLREGATFCFTMAAKDGSFSFDFAGTYNRIAEHELITYSLGDGRKVQVYFKANSNNTVVTEIFEAEDIHSPELQQQGWQAILNNFKRYAETIS